MGYAGGESRDPTYRNLGGHTETLEVDFDPAVLSFAQVLELFWESHNPFAAPRGSQYMSALFLRDAGQRSVAEARVARLEQERGAGVTTKLLAFDRFHLAEGYHQKYTLRRHRELVSALLEAYPDPLGFVNSTAAARLNGYLAGHGSRAALERDLPLLGLSTTAQARARELHDR